MAVYADRVQETSTTTGTGTLTLAGAVAGFQSFTTAFATGTTVNYCVTDGANWEVGTGVFTASGTTLTRATVLASSNGGSLVNFGVGTKFVFNVLPAAAISGMYIQTTKLSASGTFTTGPTTGHIRIRGVGGGGGGGGTAAGTVTPGGGGGAGSYAEKTFAVSPSTGYSYVCGGGGAGNSGATGSTGQASTFIVGATTVTCNGGHGGVANGLVGGTGGAISTNGDVNIAGQYGGSASSYTTNFIGGMGANSQFGGGGKGVVGTGGASGGAQGIDALAYGAGGGGASGDTTNPWAGGSGSGGLWIVEEFT